MKKKLLLTKDGELFAVYDDKDKSLYDKLGGNKNIVRATDVEYNNLNNVWQATLNPVYSSMPEQQIAHDVNRGATIAKEVVYLNEHLVQLHNLYEQHKSVFYSNSRCASGVETLQHT